MNSLGGELLDTGSLMGFGAGFGLWSLFLLNWDLGVPLRFLLPSGFQSFWIAALTIKVSNIFLIIICTLEVLKGDQF